MLLLFDAPSRALAAVSMSTNRYKPGLAGSAEGLPTFPLVSRNMHPTHSQLSKRLSKRISTTISQGAVPFYFRHQGSSTAATRRPRRTAANRGVRLYSSDKTRIMAFRLSFLISHAYSNLSTFFGKALGHSSLDANESGRIVASETWGDHSELDSRWSCVGWLFLAKPALL